MPTHIGRTKSAALYFDLFLKLLYFVFASTSTVIFQTFACDDTFDDGRAVVAVDFSLSCNSPQWDVHVGYGVFMVLVFPVGIPYLFGHLLFKNRQAIDPPLSTEGMQLLQLAEACSVERAGRCSLVEQAKDAARSRNPDETLQSIRFLFDHYLPKFWYFEILESVRRLLARGQRGWRRTPRGDAALPPRSDDRRRAAAPRRRRAWGSPQIAPRPSPRRRRDIPSIAPPPRR